MTKFWFFFLVIYYIYLFHNHYQVLHYFQYLVTSQYFQFKFFFPLSFFFFLIPCDSWYIFLFSIWNVVYAHQGILLLVGWYFLELQVFLKMVFIWNSLYNFNISSVSKNVEIIAVYSFNSNIQSCCHFQKERNLKLKKSSNMSYRVHK